VQASSLHSVLAACSSGCGARSGVYSCSSRRCAASDGLANSLIVFLPASPIGHAAEPFRYAHRWRTRVAGFFQATGF